VDFVLLAQVNITLTMAFALIAENLYHRIINAIFVGTVRKNDG